MPNDKARSNESRPDVIAKRLDSFGRLEMQLIELKTQLKDDPESAKKLRDQLAAYMEALEEIAGEGKVTGKVISTKTDQKGKAAVPVDEVLPKGRKVPLRAHVLNILEDLGCLAFTREIAHYSKARYGREIPLARFGSLANDEQEAHRLGARPRPVWLCFGLTHDGGESIKRLLGRSDWPLEKRIFAPSTGRVQHLEMTIRLCELATQGDLSADPELMKFIAADHAQALPGVEFRKGRFEFEAWIEIASKLLEEWAPRDEEARAKAAERLRSRGEHALLFGGFESLEGGSGASSREAESM